MNTFQTFWARACLKFAGRSRFGRRAYALAALAAPPYKGARALAMLTHRPFIAGSARLHGEQISLAEQSFVGDRVVLYQADADSRITLGRRACLNQDVVVEVGEGGAVTVGENTHIQPRCQLSAYKGQLRIGRGVQIAPNCAFYPYNHGFLAGQPIGDQPLTSKGGIVIEDDVWLSFGVTVLDGVTIGEGAVIGAGAVVAKDIPAGAIAAGIPAKVIGQRAANPQ
ncbi:acyltransferase [Granulosicoccaceae sp. 1_MG-2023]|nr:acyltransferase [Granulosicoccaceae sp. 1_MG-2023]